MGTQFQQSAVIAMDRDLGRTFADAAQVDLLYRQIGQLKVENDFLSRKLGK